MAYLSFDTIAASLRALQSATPSPASNYSALHYLAALDSYCKTHNVKKADCKIKKIKDEITTLVETIITLDDKKHLKTFKEIVSSNKTASNTISSNFFNGSSYDLSKNAPNNTYDYPQKTGSSLLQIKDRVLSLNNGYYNNITSYLKTNEELLAFAMWLLRKNDNINNVSANSLRKALLKTYSQNLVDVLIPPATIINNNSFSSIPLGLDSVQAQILSTEFYSSVNSKKRAYIIKKDIDEPLQQIFYGAPGTGKSHEIQEKEDGFAKVFRTTFHPDSDYSTFVGCYKPVTEKAKLWAPDNVYHPQTAVLLANPNNIENISYRYEAQAFVKAYIEAWKLYAEQITNISAIASATSTGTAAPSEEPKHKEEIVKPELNKDREDGNLPNEKENGEAEQVNTWNHIPCVLLDIEEINRGNCAQIFGDLFQLLDRNDNGFSEYEIIPDSALTKHLANAFKDLDVHVPNIDPYFKKEYKSHIKDGNTRSEDIQSGDILILPPNLYIWATMNTSDQSLFPMDSAFKRRWDWVYMPIENGIDEHGNPLGWKLEYKDYDWWTIITHINSYIRKEATSAEDKQLGYFFIKPDMPGGVISTKRFINKVLFFLWNDVFRDLSYDLSCCSRENSTILYPDFIKEQKEGTSDCLDHFFEEIGVEQKGNNAPLGRSGRIQYEIVHLNINYKETGRPSAIKRLIKLSIANEFKGKSAKDVAQAWNDILNGNINGKQTSGALTWFNDYQSATRFEEVFDDSSKSSGVWFDKINPDEKVFDGTFINNLNNAQYVNVGGTQINIDYKITRV